MHLNMDWTGIIQFGNSLTFSDERASIWFFASIVPKRKVDQKWVQTEHWPAPLTNAIA